VASHEAGHEGPAHEVGPSLHTLTWLEVGHLEGRAAAGLGALSPEEPLLVGALFLVDHALEVLFLVYHALAYLCRAALCLVARALEAHALVALFQAYPDREAHVLVDRALVVRVLAYPGREAHALEARALAGLFPWVHEVVHLAGVHEAVPFLEAHGLT
jgi:hypothetical protein